MRNLLHQIRPETGTQFDVLGLGGCSLDEVWRLAEEGQLAPGTAALARSRDQLGGGAVATTLVACRRLGLSAAFCGVVGSDDPGRAVVQGLKDEGVDTAGVRVLGAARTRCVLTVLEGAGRRTLLDLRDPALVLPEGAPSEVELGAARVLHLDGTHLPAAERALRLARKQRALVSVALKEPVGGVGGGLEALVRLADLLVLGEGFPQRYTGAPGFERALLVLSRRTSAQVIVTLGARGCVAVERLSSGAGERGGEQLLYCPAFPVLPATDTGGCGATFRAGLLAFLLDGAERAERPLEEALRFANAAAALKCRALGRRGCPTRREVDELLQRSR